MQWVEYQSKNILYLNWAYLNEEQGLQAVERLSHEYKKHPPDSILVLFNIESSYSTNTIVKKLSTLSQNSPARAIAVVGYNTIKQMIANKIRNDIFFAEDIHEAKEWLIRQ